MMSCRVETTDQEESYSNKTLTILVVVEYCLESACLDPYVLELWGVSLVYFSWDGHQNVESYGPMGIL